MCKRFSKYIAAFDYFDKCLIVLSTTSGGFFLALFHTVIDAPIGIASASLSFVPLIPTEIWKKLIKITRNKNKKHNKIVVLAWSKLNSIKNTKSKALIDNEIIHEGFTTINKEEKICRKLKESIRMMKSQRRNIEKNKLIEDGKRVGTDEIIKHGEKNNNHLRSQYKTMISYCLTRQIREGEHLNW